MPPAGRTGGRPSPDAADVAEALRTAMAEGISLHRDVGGSGKSTLLHYLELPATLWSRPFDGGHMTVDALS